MSKVRIHIGMNLLMIESALCREGSFFNLGGFVTVTLREGKKKKRKVLCSLVYPTELTEITNASETVSSAILSTR